MTETGGGPKSLEEGGHVFAVVSTLMCLIASLESLEVEHVCHTGRTTRRGPAPPRDTMGVTFGVF